MISKTIQKLRFQKGNYRRGGIFMIPGVVLGITIAYLAGDKGIGMTSIALFGFVTSAILIIIGDRRNKKHSA
ncbi:hypothetical protein RBH29_10595 [Herbivorax sp. ANBcel31]|uniref:hypothetical protein n=1 Tax=Herbivorax sp. ANBcel31 TaxID=3069754 RepID=UPI0027B531CE|nr:hypothetical protein [Herbivorax sp. ANBcel31]MDQ2086874.1 hypothetical protein [Herbivorax sp. ANBcel31]